MRKRTLADLDRIVALGGGHGLGRVMSALHPLGPRLTGIVTTTDNGGSTGRIRQSEGGIAWGDTRNCLNQLISEPSIASAMFEYRFNGQGELAGHNLGNLMLKALDNLSVRPLEAINLIRGLLKIEAQLIPMSEQAVDLVAVTDAGEIVYGEMAVDRLNDIPASLDLNPPVAATREGLLAIAAADLVIIGPGSFFTSLMPLLLLPDLAQSLRRAQAPILFIDNLGREFSPAAAGMTVKQKLDMMERVMGRQSMIDAVITSPSFCAADLGNRLIIQRPLAAEDVPHLHDRQQLRAALDSALQGLG